jgi:hypothetical protein
MAAQELVSRTLLAPINLTAAEEPAWIVFQVSLSSSPQPHISFHERRPAGNHPSVFRRPTEVFPIPRESELIPALISGYREN